MVEFMQRAGQAWRTALDECTAEELAGPKPQRRLNPSTVAAASSLLALVGSPAPMLALPAPTPAAAVATPETLVETEVDGEFGVFMPMAAAPRRHTRSSA